MTVLAVSRQLFLLYSHSLHDHHGTITVVGVYWQEAVVAVKALTVANDYARKLPAFSTLGQQHE